MKKIFTIAQRELLSIFNTPIAYLFLALWVGLTAFLFFFYSPFFALGQADVAALFRMMPAMLVVLAPVLTMRLWSEELRSGTRELLVTLPYRPRDLILGKFLAAYVVLSLALLSTIGIPICISVLGPLDWGPVIGGYVGSLAMGGMLLALGLWTSCLSSNQVVAMMGALVGGLALLLMFGHQTAALIADDWPQFARVLESFGLLQHFDSFDRGLLVVGDFLYFVGGGIIFCVLAVFSLQGWRLMGGRTGRRLRHRIHTIAFAVIAVGFVLLVCDLTSSWRLDLTATQVHSLHPTTVQFMKSLEEPLVVQYWVSDQLPASWDRLRRDTISLLRELERRSGGLLTLELKDPDSWIDQQIKLQSALSEEQAALSREQVEQEKSPAEAEINSFLGDRDRQRFEFMRQYGVLAIEEQTVESGRFEVVQFFSGLRMLYGGQPALVLSRHDSVQSLEKEMLARLDKLTRKKKPLIAFFHGRKRDEIHIPANPKNPLQRARTLHRYQPFLDAEDVKESYDVVTIDLDGAPVPASTDLLIVAQPDGLFDRQRYEIERYLASGGRVIFLVSNFSADYAQLLEQRQLDIARLETGLEQLFDRWGLALGTNPVCSQQHGLFPMQVAGEQQPVEFPLNVMASEGDLSGSSAITRRLPALFLPLATPLLLAEEKLAASGLKCEILVTSKAHSWLPDYAPSLTPEMMREPTDGFQGEQNLVVLIDGIFPTLFEEGSILPPWRPEEGVSEERVSALEALPGRALVISSVDFLKFYTLQLYPIGGEFMLEAMDALTMSEALLDLRSRDEQQYRLRDSTGNERRIIRYGNALGIPAMILCFGFLRSLMRARATRSYELEFQKRRSK